MLFRSNSHHAGVLRLYTNVYILFACFLGLTPFLLVFCACTHMCTFYCLFVGFYSLFTGVLRLYTHVYILFACFLGLTPIMHVFYACIPTYTFYLSAFWV